MARRVLNRTPTILYGAHPLAPPAAPAFETRVKEEFLTAYDSHLEKIYRYIFSRIRVKALAQDLTSEVFLRAWTFIKRGAVVRHWAAFLYTLAANALKDFYRSKAHAAQPFSALGPHTLEKALQEEPDFAGDFDRGQQYETALARLNDLKPMYRQVVLLRYVEGYRSAEIARQLGRSHAWVRVVLHRALKKLKSRCQTL
ncbi:RNA polymerase sigma factor [Candidatus Parcubacteria bacterium]|nr:RNA polymerase sigma factor [Candidatus Parcubacteria bacterium]MBI4385209.1 RNA polymerase sigma factor [Candidatus Parcubacteria bacterium]